MANPHPVGYLTDPPVRPGTSDALTARTIDATVHPPLVRAQETVVALGPRIAESVNPVTQPLFLGIIALTLLFVLVARRLKYQPAALVLSALLVLGLTSFRPLPKWEQTRHMSVRPKTRIQSAPPTDWVTSSPPPAEPVDAPDYGRQMPVMLPPMPAMPRSPEGDIGVEMMRRAEEMMRDEQVREMLQQLQWRLREEAKSRRWHRIVAKYKVHTQDLDPIDLVLTR
jgi:hypothetical protein